MFLAIILYFKIIGCENKLRKEKKIKMLLNVDDFLIFYLYHVMFIIIWFNFFSIKSANCTKTNIIS